MATFAVSVSGGDAWRSTERREVLRLMPLLTDEQGRRLAEIMARWERCAGGGSRRENELRQALDTVVPGSEADQWIGGAMKAVSVNHDCRIMESN